MKQHGPEEPNTGAAEALRRLIQAMKDVPEVVSVASAFTCPYTNGSWTSDYDVGTEHFAYELNQVPDDFKDVLGLRLTRGRWFSREDDGSSGFEPVVINERMASGIFGDTDPIGKAVPEYEDRSSGCRPWMKVVGVVSEYRQHGEFQDPGDFLLRRDRLDQTVEMPARFLLLRVRPGTTADLEERLMSILHHEAQEWSFTLSSIADLRTKSHRESLAPVMAVALIAGFLLVMVALGLTGVLWQNVTQRTREIGLRRAKGATAVAIHGQILGEILVMTTLAMAAGGLVIVQFPLLGWLGFVRPGVLVASLSVSAAALYLLAAAYGFYPSRLATRVQPAEALHYE